MQLISYELVVDKSDILFVVRFCKATAKYPAGRITYLLRVLLASILSMQSHRKPDSRTSHGPEHPYNCYV